MNESHALSQPSVPSVGRSGTFDTLRGIAMLGVVLSHVLVGVADAGLASGSLARWNSALYLVHMPIFALVAGMMLSGSSEKRTRWSYFVDRTGSLIYLYLVWTIIQGGVELATNPFRNNHTSFVDVITFWTPIAHLWFISWLIIANSIALLIRPWRRQSAFIVLSSGAVIVVLSIFFWGTEGSSIFERGMALTGFLFVGAFLTRERCETWIARRSVATLTGFLLVSTVLFGLVVAFSDFSAPTTDDSQRDALSIALGVAGTLTGSGALIALTMLLDRLGRRMRFLQWVGRESLAIFLMHLLFTAGARIALIRIGIDWYWIHILIGTGAGVLGPLLLAGPIARATPLAWVLKPPHVTGWGSRTKL